MFYYKPNTLFPLVKVTGLHAGKHVCLGYLK